MFLYRHTQTQISYHQYEALCSLEVITFICILTHFKRGHVCIYEPIKIFFFWVSMKLSHSKVILFCSYQMVHKTHDGKGKANQALEFQKP